MARSSLPYLLLLFISTTTSTPTHPHPHSPPHPSSHPKLAHLHFYFHEIRTGPNLTRLNMVQSTMPNGFGAINVFDNLMTSGPDPDSPLVGRCQGVGARASLDGSRGWTSINFVLNKGKFEGSSFMVVGSFVVTGNVSERIVVGRTGAFRMCRGYALNYGVESREYGVVTEFDVYIWYYPKPRVVEGGVGGEDVFEVLES